MFFFFFDKKTSQKNKEIKRKVPQKKVTFSNSFAKKINKNRDFFISEEIYRQYDLFDEILSNYTNDLTIEFKSSLEELRKIRPSHFCENIKVTLNELIDQNDELDDCVIELNKKTNNVEVINKLSKNFKNYYISKCKSQIVKSK